MEAIRKPAGTKGDTMENRFSRKMAAGGLTCAVLVASALLVVADIEDQYSDWSAPDNLGPTVNSASNDAGSFISKDGLSFYFNSNRPVPDSTCPGGLTGLDIYVSQRGSVDEPWGAPQNLGPTINSCSDDQTPTLSLDGHRLYFASSRPEGFGDLDIYVSRRRDERDDLGWGPPVNLGSGVNTDLLELGPAPFEDDETGTVTLYFTRGPAIGTRDIYASTLEPNGSFGPAGLVAELSSPFDDARPALRRDGLEIFFDSNRPGSLCPEPPPVSCPLDIWTSTRASTSDPWSSPVNLGPDVNSTALDARPALSFDGTSLYFHSGRRPGGLGGNDIYVSTRAKLREPE